MFRGWYGGTGEGSLALQLNEASSLKIFTISRYGLRSSEIGELHELDRSLLRQILNTKISTPAESLFLELGCLDVETVIKSRRINYLH